MSDDAPQPDDQPSDAPQPDDTWPVPDHKYGMPFKIFPRDAMAQDIYEWVQEQRRKARHADEPPKEPPADNLSPS